MALGVDTDCLKAIGCAWSSLNAWAFPMRDQNENVIGIRLRNDQGDKWAVKGSKSGLFIPGEYSWFPDGICYLVEGPTDLAAAMTIGLRAFGRAACLGQETMILDYIRRNRIERLVIVTDNDDPGIRGAEKTAINAFDTKLCVDSAREGYSGVCKPGRQVQNDASDFERLGMGQGAEGGMSTNPKPQAEEQINPWAEYERRKQELSPDLSPSDREAQLRRIADDLGI